MANITYRPTQAGVSLVELSISLAIIGLLIATVTTGFNMIHSAKIRKTVTELTSFHTAIGEFEESYGSLPGDLPTAYNFWGDDCGTNDVGNAGSCNGNGNGAIEFSETTTGTPQEDLLAISHLAFGNYIPGSFTGRNVSADIRYEVGTNTPESDAISGEGFMIRTESNSGGDRIYGSRGHTIRMGSLVNIDASGKQYPIGGAVVAKDAYAIDVKIDDGKASDGLFYTIRQPTAGSVGCVDAAWNAAAAEYVLDDTNETCHLVYWYKKF